MKTIVRGDTVPLRFALTRKNDGQAWAVPNFSGATPRLIVKADVTPNAAVLFDRAGSFESAPDGIVSIPRQPDDFGGVGEQEAVAEIEVTYADGTQETFPTSPGKLPVVIVDDLG